MTAWYALAELCSCGDDQGSPSSRTTISKVIGEAPLGHRTHFEEGRGTGGPAEAIKLQQVVLRGEGAVKPDIPASEALSAP